MDGRRVRAGSLALLVTLVGAGLAGGGPARAEPLSSASRSDPATSSAVEAERPWTRIAAGEFHSCGIRRDRTLWCWGDNSESQLGIQDGSWWKEVPTQVGRDADWVRVTGGARHTCAIRTDRSLWCWGSNSYGQIGVGDYHKRWVPTQVGTDYDWLRVWAGDLHTCGTRTDGSLWCWGNNWKGELGLGDQHNRLRPTRVGTDTD